ncbi:hypothetical protein SDC9_132213 [bioreactor metagenome]|uniref:Uncharacterized protein n=1 Tax=bioreactor metagenome TaxID=1076179 RepID=A0A645D6Y8_9ZZZZ
MGNPTHLDGILHLQGDCRNVVAVEVGADDAGGNRIAVQPDHQVEHGGPVSHLDAFFMKLGAENLLRKIEGVIFPLLVGQAGVVLQILQRDILPLCKGACAAGKNMGLGGKQGVKRQIALPQKLFNDLAVKRVQIENSNFAAQGSDGLHNIMGLRFPHGQLIFVGVGFADHADKGVHRKGVMLGRDAEHPAGRLLAEIPPLQKIRLLNHLPGIAQKFHAVLRQGHALGGPGEQLHAGFGFQLLDGAGQAGLRQKKIVRRLADGTAVHRFNKIF